MTTGLTGGLQGPSRACYRPHLKMQHTFLLVHFCPAADKP